ncbi:LysR family transcriptional regulator [Rhodoplanes serenus]|uniref:LysR family transcriptional regulator n=1 Tax=Rhodoplanes serenus TaxID=200615 RepID=A0A9X4XLM8_9BRAD|nr:LysR family transcriptional regulator [Rhodoplanes serenus]MTW16449.1 LysR family transcriptional regulator [Rhodoplanes serenus]
MDLRALRYFHTVATCGSFSRGSALLHISQPAVSRTIRELEADLGCSLFVRSRDGASLTDAGRILFERSGQLLRQVEQTRAEVRNRPTGLSGRITVGTTPGVGHVLAPPLLARFSQHHPNVDIRIIGGFSHQLHQYLAQGKIDLAFAHDVLPQRGLTATPLLEEEVFVVGRGEILPPGEALTACDIAKLPLILTSRPNASRRLLDVWAAREGFWVEPKYEVDDHLVTRGLLKEGLGATLMTRATLSADLLAHGIEARAIAPRVAWSLTLVARDSSSQPAVLEAFVAAARAVLDAMTEADAWPGRIAND